MSLFSRLRGLFAATPKAADRREIGATFDLAQTTRHNANHWGNADALSANAATIPGVRQAMRTRSRYETENNSLCCGIIRTIADHTVGTGPRLKMTCADRALGAQIQADFTAWAKAIGLPQKIWELKRTQAQDGECFGLLIGNPAVKNPIQLDVQLLEGDYVTSLRPYWSPYQVDGINYDPQWNPISYHLVIQRPNDVLPIVWPQLQKIDAKFVLHYYRKERPGQGRGIPELTSALELFAVLRRYIAATCSAAEVAACFAAFIKSPAPADQSSAASADAWLTMDIQRNLLTMLPDGFDVSQLHPEQPTDVFDDFVKSLVGLIARCLGMPLNIALCNSSDYNYASGRLDHQTYWTAIGIDQTRIEAMFLDRLFAAWCAEYALINGLAPESFDGIAHEWHWDRTLSIDPVKDATAVTLELRNGSKSMLDMERQQGGSGSIIAENAEFFGVSEDEMRQRMFAQIFPIAPTPDTLGVTTPVVPGDQTASLGTARSKTTIAAAGDIDLQFSACQAGLQITAGEGADSGPPKFSMTAYNGGLLLLKGRDYPVVVDLSTVATNRQSTPILTEHDPERIVGHATAIDVSGAGITASGLISGVGDDASRVTAMARNGYPWQASIGGRAKTLEMVPAGKSVSVNGQTFSGPVGVARNFALKEISFVTFGADPNTSATVTGSGAHAPGDVTMGFENWVASLGFDMSTLTNEQVQNLTNEWTAKQAAAQAAGSGGNIQAGATPAPTPQATLTPAQLAAQEITAAADTFRREMAAETQRVAKIQKVAADSPEICAKAIAENWTAEKCELEVLRASRPTAVPRFAHSLPEGASQNAVIECSMLMRTGIEASELAALDKDGRYTDDVIHAACEQRNRGYTFSRLIGEYLVAKNKFGHFGTLDNDTIRAALHLSKQDIEADAGPGGSGFTTVSLPGILSNLANKSLIRTFFRVPNASSAFCGTQDLNDFKLATRYRLTETGKFQVVGPTGELKHGTFGQESWTNQLETLGEMVTLNRQMLINDDLGAFNQLPMMLGRKAALTVESTVFSTFLSNPVGANGNNYFSTGNGNLQTGSGSVLSVDSLSTAIEQFLLQTDLGGYPIQVNPTILLVPPQLYILAKQLYKDLTVVNVYSDAKARTPAGNPHAGVLTPVQSPYLSNGLVSGSSATQWFILADPMDVPAISIGYLRGMRTPVIENAQTDMSVLGFSWRCYFDFGVGLVDYRAVQKSAGA